MPNIILLSFACSHPAPSPCLLAPPAADPAGVSIPTIARCGECALTRPRQTQDDQRRVHLQPQGRLHHLPHLPRRHQVRSGGLAFIRTSPWSRHRSLIVFDSACCSRNAVDAFRVGVIHARFPVRAPILAIGRCVPPRARHPTLTPAAQTTSSSRRATCGLWRSAARTSMQRWCLSSSASSLR